MEHLKPSHNISAYLTHSFVEKKTNLIGSLYYDLGCNLAVATLSFPTLIIRLSPIVKHYPSVEDS